MLCSDDSGSQEHFKKLGSVCLLPLWAVFFCFLTSLGAMPLLLLFHPLASCKSTLELASCVKRAGDGTRTRDSLLGKQELYH
jgi:hypothetical protein